jgi:hypothetical protein
MSTPVPAVHRRHPRALKGGDYIADRSLATVLYLALKLGRPLFCEGEAGVGKTEIAKVLGRDLKRPLIRLQCYEGPRRQLPRSMSGTIRADDRDPAGRGAGRARSQASLPPTSSMNVS